MRADTLEVPTDSVLRSARRQLGEPSQSEAATAGDGEQPEPASVARSRPAEVPQPTPPLGTGSVADEAAAAAGAAGGTGGALPSHAMVAAVAKQLIKQVGAGSAW